MRHLIPLLAASTVDGRLATLANPVNHFVDLQVEGIVSTDYKFAIFDDPQLGKEDKEANGDGTRWEQDVAHIEQMCNSLNELDNLAFIVIAGDMAHALPNDEPGVSNPGSNPPLRPAQTTDLFDAMRSCPPVPVFAIAGERDIGKKVAREMSWKGYELHFMQPYYYFQLGERYFISLDSQSYMLDFDYAQNMEIAQNMWLEKLMRTIPKEAPKTVFIHTPMFVEFAEETKASDKEKSLPLAEREYLLDLFEYYNVDTVFSGHTHFENYPAKYGNIRQVVMTSINALSSWHSKETGVDYGPEYGNNERGYYIVDVNGTSEPRVNKVAIN